MFKRNLKYIDTHECKHNQTQQKLIKNLGQNSCEICKKFLSLRKFIMTMKRAAENMVFCNLRSKKASCFCSGLFSLGITVFN